MTDLFALLGETARPWLDAEELKGKYHVLTAIHHPDVAGGGGDFAEINRAYQTLADPAARLRHLLELSGAIPQAKAVPEEIAELFAPVAEARQAADGFLKKHAAAASPLAKALLSTEQYRVQEAVEELIARLQEKQERLLEMVREADGLWIINRAAALGVLPGLWQSLNYTGKWLGALRETLFRLAGL